MFIYTFKYSYHIHTYLASRCVITYALCKCMSLLNIILLQENGPDLTWNHAKHICSKFVNNRNINWELILVYGHAGN